MGRSKVLIVLLSDCLSKGKHVTCIKSKIAKKLISCLKLSALKQKEISVFSTM